MNDPKGRSLETALGQALKEAADDETYQKVKRMSYSGNAAGEVRVANLHLMLYYNMF